MGYGRYKTGETIKLRAQARPTVAGGVAGPTTGLTDVIIDIYNDGGTQVVSDGAMTEIGSTGIYEYSYLPASQGTFTFVVTSATNKLTYVETFIVGAESSGLAYYPAQIEDTRILEFIKTAGEFFAYMRKVEKDHEGMFDRVFKDLKKINKTLDIHKKTMDEQHNFNTSKFSAVENEQATIIERMKLSIETLEKAYARMAEEGRKSKVHFDNQSEKINEILKNTDSKFKNLDHARSELEKLKEKVGMQIDNFSSDIKSVEIKFSEIATKAVDNMLAKNESLLEQKNNELRDLVSKFSSLTKNMAIFTFQKEAMESVLDQAYEKDRQISRLAATDIDKARESIEKNIENKHKEQKDKLNKLSGHIDDIDIELQLKTIGVTDANTDRPSEKRVSPSDFAHYFKAPGIQTPARKEKTGNPSS